MKENNSKVLAVLLLILAIVVFFVSLFFGKNKKEDEENLSIVNNASEFFTVNSCIYRVTNYIYKKDINSLLYVLSSKYKKENKVDETNLLDKFPKITQNSTFVSKKMYYKKISDDITKYYVFGFIRQNILHDYVAVEKQEEQKAYFIVVLDSNKQIFSIEPYSGEIFMEGDTNE